MIKKGFKLNNRLQSFLFILLVCPFTVSLADDRQPGYTLGVFPYLPPRSLEKIFAPFAEDFSQALGKPVIFESRNSYDKFTDSMKNGAFDIVFVQPFDFIVIADEHNYIPLATRQAMLTSILVVSTNSAYHKIEDLKSKTISSTDKSSAVSFLMQNEFIKRGIIPNKDIKIIHQRSHFSCMQQVIIRRVEACITARPVLRFFEYKMSTKLRIIGESGEIPSSLFATAPSVPDDDRKKLLKRILDLHNSPKGKALLARGKLKGFRKISSQDYDSVRKIYGTIK